MPHSLDHLYRYEFVVLAGEIPIVLEQQFHPVSDSLASEQILRPVMLLPRDGSGRDPATIVLSSVDRETSPPRTNFYNMISGSQREFPADKVVFQYGRLIYRRVFSLENVA